MRCKYISIKGEQCKKNAGFQKDYCYNHSLSDHTNRLQIRLKSKTK